MDATRILFSTPLLEMLSPDDPDTKVLRVIIVPESCVITNGLDQTNVDRAQLFTRELALDKFLAEEAEYVFSPNELDTFTAETLQAALVSKGFVHDPSLDRFLREWFDEAMDSMQ